eukprot:1316428-Amphidinium_carterae.1
MLTPICAMRFVRTTILSGLTIPNVQWVLCVSLGEECLRIERLHEPMCFDTEHDEPARFARYPFEHKSYMAK